MDSRLKTKNQFIFLTIIALLNFLPIHAKATTTSPCPSGTLNVNNLSCLMTPDDYQITILEIGFCNNLPTSNDSHSPLVDNSFCTQIYSNPNNTTPTTISSSLTPVALEGGVDPTPTNGTYTYAYVKINNSISYKATATLNIPTSGSIIGASAPSTDIVNSGSTAVCVTTNTPSPTYLRSANNQTNAYCSGSPIQSTYVTEIFDGLGGCPTDAFCNSGMGLQNTGASAYLTTNGAYNPSYSYVSNTATDMYIFFPLSPSLAITSSNAPNIIVDFEMVGATKIHSTNGDSTNPIIGFKNQAPNIKVLINN